MGKTNRGQRTKGNTRPSSSGHSAELLNSTGKTFSGFVGFDVLSKEMPSYVPVTGLHSLEDSEKSVDATFRMIMRRMLKRDPTTRLKAVQEFGQHCSEGEKEIIINVLPFWPRLFNKLALDIDRRIREATHESHKKLISRVKRDIAPYLKSIMGVWLLGQCDLYAPSASAAQNSFLETFLLPKQSEALIFCRAEIFSYFKDNLFEQTAKSMSEPIPTSDEDVENKYTLVITSTFHAIKFLLSTLTQDDKNAIKDDLISILKENKFWKYSKIKNPQIRGAWFSLLGALCRDMPVVLENFADKLSTSVFSCLSEPDPLVASSIWEAALHTIVNFENCWTHIDVNKVVVPQLWMLLKEGGKGNAVMLFPCLLPLLCKLPKEITTKEGFLQQFLSYLRQSVYLDKISTSSKECDAIIVTFMECLEFIVFNRLDLKNCESSLLEKIMNEQLIPLTESSFLDKNSYLVHSKLFPSIGFFLQKLEKKCFEEIDASIADVYKKSLILYWDHVYEICSILFTDQFERRNEFSELLAHFFRSTYLPLNYFSQKPKHKVTFEDDVMEAELHHKTSNSYFKFPLANQNLLNKDSFMLKNTIKFCHSLCGKLEAASKTEQCYIKLLSEIIFIARSTELFKGLMKEFGYSHDCEKDATNTFFKSIILKWMKNKSYDKLDFSCLIDITFAICSCMEKQQGLNILIDCCKVENVVLSEELLRKCLECYHEDVVSEWLRNSELEETITNLIKCAISLLLCNSDENSNIDTSAYHNALLYYLQGCNLTASEKGIGSITNILQTLKVSTEQYCEVNTNSHPILLNFICDIIITILKHCKECWSDSTLEDLLILIFRHSFKSHPTQSVVLLKKTILTWQTAIEVSISNTGQPLHESGFIKKASTEIHDLIINFNSTEEFSTVLDHGLSLLSTIEEVLTSADTNFQGSVILTLSILLERILPSNKDWERLKGELCLNILPAFFGRKIFYPFPSDTSVPEATDNIQQYVMVSEIVSDILIKEISRVKDDEDQNIVEGYIIKHLPHLLWSFSYCEGNGHLNRQGTTDCDRTEKLQKNCFKMLAFLSHKELLNQVEVLFHLSLAEGLEWALPLQTIIEVIKTIHPEYVANISELLEQARKSDSHNKYITAQMLIHHVSTERRTMLLKSLIEDFLLMKISSDGGKETLLGILAEVCCCVQDSEVLQSSEIQIYIVDLILNISKQKETYLKNSDEEYILNLQKMAILLAVAKYAPCMLSEILWNLIFGLLTTSIQKCRSSIHLQKACDFLLLHQSSSLLYVVSLLLADDNGQSSLDLPKAKWKSDVFNDVYQDFLFVFIFLAGISKKLKSLPMTLENLLATVSEVTEFIPGDLILNTFMAHVLLNNLIQNSGEKQQANSYDNVNSILKMFIPYLTSSVHSIQFAAHSMIVKLMPHLPDIIKETSKSDCEDDDDKIPIKLYPLIELLESNNQIVDSILMDEQIGDCCTVIPYTDSYVYSMAYLLVWIEIFELFSHTPSEVNTGYAAYLEDNKLLSSLFSNVYRLMPENPVQSFKTSDSRDTPKKEGCQEVFINPPILSTLDHPSSKMLQSVSCYVFYMALRKVPSSVRTWWSNLDKRSAEIVDRFVSKYVSCILISEEIQSVCDSGVQFNNMTVRARPNTREVVATYTVDDNTIELFVQLPRNYPLGPVKAEKRGKIVIAGQEWRHWLMQLTTLLTIQNRSMLESMTIWAKNLDKKFEGIEECTICYYILHAKSFKLPKLSCHVCGKKFHADCLYKWFRTSNNSTCPLCRNEF